MAKVSVRDALLADLLERYPTESLSLSDRILKLITEVDTLRSLVQATRDSPPAQPDSPPEAESPTEAVAEEMLNALANNVSVGDPT